jgi:hypothetical protein
MATVGQLKERLAPLLPPGSEVRQTFICDGSWLHPYLYRRPVVKVRCLVFWVCSSALLTLGPGRFFVRAGSVKGRAAIAERRPEGAPLTGPTVRR